jgi:CHASE3 domain sensor protein
MRAALSSPAVDSERFMAWLLAVVIGVGGILLLVVVLGLALSLL